MRVVLNNVDASFLPILESFKSIMPGLEINKEPCIYTHEEIKARLEANIEKIENGTAKIYNAQEIRQTFKK